MDKYRSFSHPVQDMRPYFMELKKTVNLSIVTARTVRQNCKEENKIQLLNYICPIFCFATQYIQN